jgi:hypothetical protein
MEDVVYADAMPAERRRAPQARTAKEIDSSARLSQMSAQLLRKDSIEPPGSADGRGAVVLARCAERNLSGKAWDGHPTTPEFDYPGQVMPQENKFR